MKRIEYITVAGTFNDWNPKSKAFRMKHIGQRTYQLTVSKEGVMKDKKPAFKFVVNGDMWLPAPEKAKNVDLNDKGKLGIK